MSTTTTDAVRAPLPVTALLALASAAFITVLTEALPAGLLPHMACSLAVPEAWAGQTVTAYAIGSLAAAIPLTSVTQGLRRRPLLLAALAGFVVAHTVSMVSGSFFVTMVARCGGRGGRPVVGTVGGLRSSPSARGAEAPCHCHRHGRDAPGAVTWRARRDVPGAVGRLAPVLWHDERGE